MIQNLLKNIAFIWGNINPFEWKNVKVLKAIVSIYPGIATVGLLFLKDKIIEETGNFTRFVNQSDNIHYTVGWIVLFYWLLLIFWVFCYFTFVTNESTLNKINNSNLKSAIFRAPNPKIYSDYRDFFDKIKHLLFQIDYEDVLNETNRKYISEILATISELTNTFMNKTENGIIYGVSIMFYVHTKSGANKEIIEKLKADEYDWIHFKAYDVSLINGVLCLVPELCFTKEKTVKEVPKIVLPIVYTAGIDSNIIKRQNIPGASTAALLLQDVFNTRDENHYKHLAKDEVINAKNYWENRLPNIGSVFSLSIPYDRFYEDTEALNIIGVLNIDCTKENILGIDSEYHVTFGALMHPIMHQLSSFLSVYYDKYMEKLTT
jgi:hypothetical protein